jgi:hypothetical protein
MKELRLKQFHLFKEALAKQAEIRKQERVLTSKNAGLYPTRLKWALSNQLRINYETKL